MAQRYSTGYGGTPDTEVKDPFLPTPRGATPNDPRFSVPAALAYGAGFKQGTRWKRTKLRVILPFFAAVLLTATVAGGAYLTIVLGPNEKMGPLSIKAYNQLISVAGNALKSCIAVAIALGARTYVTRAMLGDGITLGRYTFAFAVGNGGTIRKATFSAAVAFAIYESTNQCSSAITGLYNAGSATLTTTQLVTAPNFATSNFSAAELTQNFLLQNQDFEGLFFTIGQIYRTPNGTLDKVAVTNDYVLSSLSNTMTASSWHARQLTTLNSSLASPYLSAIQDGSGSATITYAAPAFDAVTTCSRSDVPQINVTSVPTDPNYSMVTITDDVCGKIDLMYKSLEGTAAIGVYTCQNSALPNTAVTSYFLVEVDTGQTAEFAKCQTAVTYGLANAVYFESTRSLYMNGWINPTEYRYNVTERVRLVLDNKWNTYMGPIGSLGLSSAVTGRNGTLIPLGDMEQITSKLYTLAGAKYYDSIQYLRLPGTTSHTLEYVLRSNIILVGPEGLAKLWLILIIALLGLTLLSLYFALIQATTPLDPLDAPGMLAIAQNSQGSASLHGTCTGNLDHMNDPGVTMKYRVISAGHLGTVWGDDTGTGMPLKGAFYH